MTLATLGALLIVWITAIGVPGPDLLQVLRVGAKNTRAGVFCAIGLVTGITIWMTASMLGLSAFVLSHPMVLYLVQLVGGIFIGSIGWRSFKDGLETLRSSPHGGTNLSFPTEPTDDERPLSPLQAWRVGILTNLSNPKAIVFFGSIFAQFLNPGMSIAWRVGVALLLIVVALIWFVGFALSVGKLGKAYLNNGGKVDIAAGILFLIIAIVMIAEGVIGIAGS